MSTQHDYVIADQAGTAFLADINAALAAIVKENEGATAPATTYAYMIWADTTSGWLKQRDSANAAWILRAPLGTGAAVDIASATTLDLTSNSASSGIIRVTGTTATTGITLADGQTRLLRAAGAWPITHGASLICPGSASYTCAAGDLILAIGEAAGVVRLMINPSSLVPAVIAQATAEAGTDTTPRLWTAERVAQAIAALETSGGATLGTPQATTSGTYKDFTIAAGAKQVTLSISGFSTNGTSNYLVQLGDAGGIEATGYAAGCSSLSTGVGTTSFTTGFGITNGSGAGNIHQGSLVLTVVDSSTNTWIAQGTSVNTDSTRTYVSSGSKSLSGELTTVRITTVNGTDTLDGGKANTLTL